MPNGRSYPAPSRRRTRHLGRQRRSWAGQAIVELALTLPLLLFLLLGLIEVGFLEIAKMQQERDTGLVADWTARHPGEDPAPVMDGLDGCMVVVSTTDDVVDVAATCQYQPVATRGLWDGLPISSHAEAVVATPEPTPEPTPTPEPSVEP